MRVKLDLGAEVVKVEYPLKQGLKPFFVFRTLSIPHLVKVEYPLKQGLKQVSKYNLRYINHIVKVEYPLKQGLKPPLRLRIIITIYRC